MLRDEFQTRRLALTLCLAFPLHFFVRYGVPIFLPNGNVNPAYLAAERKENEMAKKNNRKTLTARRKQMESKGTFLLDSYIEKKIGNVGSGKAYYQSGK